ncbi:hypothetical protein F53441_7716 [Fusarium austroafricanum]|uniref:Nucleoside phosphorylase domain-containing protein n=1 Tax=Fusarium austroafricanum TaxID=2364996 RepID=A0A8H4KEH7_9HYPO|nr:hypothetical protein F53441_7716 [Fusarium austroafricanum]
MTNYDIYTIGWICAIRAELVAACELLDEEIDETVPTPTNDNNTYTLGKIGQHHVVIAALPRGQYGLTSAASVGRDMVRTFPNVRLGFMVGIGGGVPTEYDIRLGDVVVGSPSYRSGGLVQYDHGKATQDTGINIMGALNQPPISILTAITKLSALHERKGNNLKQTVEKVLKENENLVEHYERPHKDTDRLYKAEFVHPSGMTSCSTACPESNLIPRQPRKRHEDSPRIHYGLIASGSQLMEDAIARDRLAVKEHVLCFEMEAAGLANHFPCIAIRGICDYSDSHRGRDWQGYAALVAAAYAKELLLQIPPKKVEEEKKMKDIFDEIREPILETKEQVGAMYRNEQREKELKILDWLKAVDYSSQQESLIQQHQLGTGQWFTISKTFQNWLETKNTLLFCSGMPGAGKTMTAAITIDYLKNRFSNDHGTGVAYVYCNYQRRNEQKIHNLFASLLQQLAQSLPSFPDALQSLYVERGNGRGRPSLEDITRTLSGVINLYDRALIIVDALDEHQETETLFSELCSLQEHTMANIFITSRPPSQNLKNKLHGCLMLDIQADDHDVRLYIDQRMTNILVLSDENTEIPDKMKQDLKKLIRKRISEVANGIFLLARFHLDSLMNKTKPNDIEAALRDLPTGPNAYQDAYEKTIKRIASQHEEQRDLAKRTLTWLTLAKEPLTKEQLRTALSIREGISELGDGDLESTNIILHVCMGLVKIEEGYGDRTVSLLHFTTMEYLKANPDSLLSLESADERTIIASSSDSAAERKKKARRYYEGRITASCGIYLRFAAFRSGQCEVETEHSFEYKSRHMDETKSILRRRPFTSSDMYETKRMLERRLSEHPLYSYAAKNWIYHARETESRSEVLDFLKSELHTSASSQLVPAFRSGLYGIRFRYESVKLGRVTGLHLAAYFGLDVEAAALLSNGMEPDVRDGWGRTPLSYASEEGHIAVVDQLLGYPVDPEFRSDDDGHGSPRTALSHAARRGHAEVVTVLLKKGFVNPDSTPSVNHGELHRSPLSFASEAGYVAVVKILLQQKGVEPDSKCPASRTPLSYATGAGHLVIAKLLLETKKVDPDSRDGNGLTKRGRTPLSYAAEGGHKSLVKLLLEIKGVKRDSKDLSNRSPLSFAAGAGHETVVEILLATKDVDPDSKDNADMTPLCHAASAGHGPVVKRLLAIKDVHPEPLGDDSRPTRNLTTGKTPSLDDMIMLLLANGRVDPNAKDSKGWTPLFHAVMNGHGETVDLLLAREDVDVNAQDNSGRTALSNAVNYPRATFELLLDHQGLKPDLSDNNGRTPLSYAAERGNIEMINLLLGNEHVDPDTQDASGRTPLSYAAQRGNDLEVELLLKEDGVDPNSRDASGRTPLSYAGEKAGQEVFELLLADDRVEADLEDISGRTPLSYIAERAQEMIDKLNNSSGYRYFGSRAADHRQWDTEKLDCMTRLIQKILTEKRVNPLFKDNQGRTPVDIMPELRYYKKRL